MVDFIHLWYTFHVQVFWNYHTMISIGSCFLLEKVYTGELPQSVRLRLVVFFNGHPYLVPYAISAIANELERGTSEEKIQKFIHSVVGMLGAIGDSYYWNGLKPLMLLLICVSALAVPSMPFVLSVTASGLFLYNVLQIRERYLGIVQGKERGFLVIKEIKAIKHRWGNSNFSKIIFFSILACLLLLVSQLYDQVFILFIGLAAFVMGWLTSKKGNALLYIFLSVLFLIIIEIGFNFYDH